MRGFHQVSKHEKTFETTRPQAEWFYCFRVFGNLMKPEARVFEITSPTKEKIEAVVILMSFLKYFFVDRNQRFEALIEILSLMYQCVKLFLHLLQCFSVLLFVSSKQTRCFTSQVAENRFKPTKTFEEEV